MGSEKSQHVSFADHKHVDLEFVSFAEAANLLFAKHYVSTKPEKPNFTESDMSEGLQAVGYEGPEPDLLLVYGPIVWWNALRAAVVIHLLPDFLQFVRETTWKSTIKLHIHHRNSVATGEVYPLDSEVRICEECKTGDVVTVELGESRLINHTTGKEYKLKPIGDAGPVIEAGGIFAYARKAGMIPNREA
ncbi:hypothetical protein K7X08_006057 [Anisodus acutangulus]|uniref:Uncharacterized protein n=1 Tax=Anisodus acutangulus TaxID=402998 RepID=A0A9Q1LUQ1_9SOLA|nr:hypothetical protein K7X08_006057 [Anisodus acutangulus]